MAEKIIRTKAQKVVKGAAQRKYSPTRQECIREIQRLAKARPENYITRRLYLTASEYPAYAWEHHFATFGALREAAGLPSTQAPKVPIKPKATPPVKVSESDCVADLQRVAKEHPEAEITRNFYRRHGKCLEAQWNAYFPKFAGFLAAAGLVEDKTVKTTAEAEVADEFIYKQNYTYNEMTDTYVTFLPRLGKSLVFSGERHRAIKRLYSAMVDKNSTINEICRDFQIPRAYFIAYKDAHGWTHDQDPFTREEHTTRSTDDMVQEAEQLSRFTVAKEFQKREWAAIQVRAKKWDDFEQNVLVPLLAAIGTQPAAYKTPKLTIKTAREPWALMMAPFDLHFGKHGWEDETGQSYSRQQARELLLEKTQENLTIACKMGRPEKIIVASASDYLHIDNPQGSTTGGTPQDCDGTRAQILMEGCELAKDHIEMLRKVAPVEWYAVPGNHDSDSALSVMLFLQAWYRNTPDVTISTVSAPRKRAYVLYGNSLLGFGHGDKEKPGDLHALMTKEAKGKWTKSEYQYFFTGHLHHKVVQEIHGLTHIQLKSLSGIDRWHSNAGYITSGRALQSFMVTRDRGIVAEFICPVKSDKVFGIKQKH